MKPRRKRLRHPAIDYHNGEFSITINTHRFRHTLGTVEDGEFAPNAIGEIVEQAWENTVAKMADVVVGAFQLMPNHLHAVVQLHRTRQPLSRLIGTFKSAVTREVRAAGLWQDKHPFWHRSFHERKIWNDASYRRTVQYVEDNPKKWDR